MALRVPQGNTTKPRLGSAPRPLEAFTRRPILAAVLLTAAVLTIFALKSLSSGSVTVTTVTTPAVRTRAAVRVPTGNQLVLVGAGLATSPAPPRRADLSRRATASRARISAIHHRRAKLSFTLKAGNDNAKIEVVTVRLPGGIAFSSSRARLEAGIVVKTGPRRLKRTVELSHGVLMIRLRTPASRVHVRIASPAIIVSRALAHAVRTRETTTLYTPVTATNTNQHTTRLTLKQRTR